MPDQLVEVLTRGVLEPEGRLVDASNTTLRCWATLDGVKVRCVYKPVAGERPLWDFPDGTLAGREVCAYLVCAATGWDLVPPTVHRDGPLGPGACQLWIEEAGDPLVGFVADDELPAGWHRIAAARDTGGRAYALAHADDTRLARMAIFDAVINNADRKGGHVLVSEEGSMYGVDHGVCFHEQPKLRTVLASLVDAVDGALGAALAAYLSRAEVTAITRRIQALRDSGRFATPSPDWPAVPWPPI